MRDEVLGEKELYARLEDVPEKIDIVNVFRRSEHCRERTWWIQRIKIGAKTVWMQEDVVDAGCRESRSRGGDECRDG